MTLEEFQNLPLPYVWIQTDETADDTAARLQTTSYRAPNGRYVGTRRLNHASDWIEGNGFLLFYIREAKDIRPGPCLIQPGFTYFGTEDLEIVMVPENPVIPENPE